MKSHIQQRQDNFARWWRKNHHRRPAHTWLASHVKRVAFSYNFPPEVFDAMIFATKRFYNSEYRRLSKDEAWTMWRFTHPLYPDRVKVLMQTSEHLQGRIDELKQVRRAQPNPDSAFKPADSAKKTFTVEVRNRRAINR